MHWAFWVLLIVILGGMLLPAYTVSEYTPKVTVWITCYYLALLAVLLVGGLRIATWS